jgi:hypothetical protein
MWSNRFDFSGRSLFVYLSTPFASRMGTSLFVENWLFPVDSMRFPNGVEALFFSSRPHSRAEWGRACLSRIGCFLLISFASRMGSKLCSFPLDPIPVRNGVEHPPLDPIPVRNGVETASLDPIPVRNGVETCLFTSRPHSRFEWGRACLSRIGCVLLIPCGFRMGSKLRSFSLDPIRAPNGDESVCRELVVSS